VKVEAVRPASGNILDMWDDMMRPFEDREAQDGNQDIKNEDDEDDNKEREREVVEVEEKDEAVSEGEGEEGIKAAIGESEKLLSKEEVSMHMVNHIPFRSWCSHCVKGKSSGNQHGRRRRDEGEARQPVVSIDYMCMHDNQAEGEERGMPIMVIKDRRTKIIRARVLPQKGNHAYGIKVLSGVIESLGHSKSS